MSNLLLNLISLPGFSHQHDDCRAQGKVDMAADPSTELYDADAYAALTNFWPLVSEPTGTVLTSETDLALFRVLCGDPCAADDRGSLAISLTSYKTVVSVFAGCHHHRATLENYRLGLCARHPPDVRARICNVSDCEQQYPDREFSHKNSPPLVPCPL